MIGSPQSMWPPQSAGRGVPGVMSPQPSVSLQPLSNAYSGGTLVPGAPIHGPPPAVGTANSWAPNEPIAELSTGTALRPATAAPAPFGGPAGLDAGLGDVDVTVMAYAQWLSEMKQNARNAQYQQQAELDLMRDAVNACNNELVDFKRHSSTVQQQLQGQVSELREQMAEALKEIGALQRQRTDIDVRCTNEINGLRDALNIRQAEMDAVRRSQAEQISQLQSGVLQIESKFQHTESEVGSLKKALTSSQEQTIGKFSEVDKAMSLFHSSVSGIRSELGETRGDWKKGQDLLGQAISTLSQDLADFEKHSHTVMNKLQSDMYKLEEQDRSGKERTNRVESQLTGIQQNLYSATNDLILMKAEQGESKAPSESFRSPTPMMPLVSRTENKVSRADSGASLGAEQPHLKRHQTEPRLQVPSSGSHRPVEIPVQSVERSFPRSVTPTGGPRYS